MNKSKKTLFIGLIFTVAGMKAKIDRRDLEAIGSVLREAKEIKGINDEFDRYVLDPIAALGEFLWNLDILEPEVTNALKGIKNFKILASCSKVPSEYLTLSEADLKNKLKPVDFERALKARKACPTVACTGDRLACVIQGIQDLSKFLTSVQKALFGYYKAEGKAYLLCPEGKGCSKVPGISEVVLGISQQQQIYRDVLKPKVQEPLAKVINVLNKLDEILTRHKGYRASETPATPKTEESTTSAEKPSLPAAPGGPKIEPTSSSTSVPEAPTLETPAGNIPDAPPLQEASNIPAAPPLEPSKPSEKPAGQPKKPTQKAAPEKPGMPSAQEFQEGKKGLRPVQKTEKKPTSEEQRLAKIREQTETPGSWETD